MQLFKLSEVPIYTCRCKRCHHWVAKHISGKCQFPDCMCTIKYSTKFDREKIITKFLQILKDYPGPLSILDLNELHGTDVPDNILHAFRQQVREGVYNDVIAILKQKPMLLIHKSNIGICTPLPHTQEPFWQILDDIEAIIITTR
jgi:hypothetical protein